MHRVSEMHIQALAGLFIFCVCYQSAVRLVPETIADNPVKQASNSRHGLKVLYVLECEGHAEWQAVPHEDPVVAWVQTLTDRLTLHTERPDGEDLTVSRVLAVRTTQQHAQAGHPA